MMMVCGNNNQIHLILEVRAIFQGLGCTILHHFQRPFLQHLALMHSQVGFLPISIILTSFTMRTVLILLCQAAWAIDLLILLSRISRAPNCPFRMHRIRWQEQVWEAQLHFQLHQILHCLHNKSMTIR
jgi:hypothetical protein